MLTFAVGKVGVLATPTILADALVGNELGGMGRNVDVGHLAC